MNLHDLAPKHIYDHLPLLTPDRLDEIGTHDEEDAEYVWASGHLTDIWREDGRAYGTWAGPDQKTYVIRVKAYEAIGTWAEPRTNLVNYRRQIRQGPWVWDTEEENCLTTRPPFAELDRLDGPDEQDALPL